MLAFTFGIAASRFEIRKQILLDEVNAIGTTYLRANLLEDTTRNEVKKLLREYVDLLADLVHREKYANKPENLQALIAHTKSIENKIWSYASTVSKQNQRFGNDWSIHSIS